MSRRALFAVPLLLAAVALAGCQGSADDATPTAGAATATPTATQSATSGATPSATASPAPTATDAAEITDVGVYDIVVGEQVPADSTAAEWDPKLCGEGGGGWKPVTAGDADERFDFDFILNLSLEEGSDTAAVDESAPVNFIVIPTDALSTAAGIHVGSTRAELEAAYPDFAAVYGADDERSLSTDLYVLENDTAQTVFEVTRADAEGLEGATPDTVWAITVQQASDKAFSISGTDTASGCFA